MTLEFFLKGTQSFFQSMKTGFPLKTQLIPTELTGKIFLPKSVNVKNHHMGKTLQTSGKSKVIT